ncbi:MAG: glycosyltransferase family 2 protein [Clostridiales bacterium]|nr:glycosyltransferase family 2 protein [Clostridiales bacterium]
MVTAVITTYQREPSMVSRAIESVIHQTYRDIELIIVDDSPEDYPLRADVEKTAREFENKRKDISVRYIAHEKNLGACAARNTGIRYANGEYIAFLDDDDEWMPEKIEKQVNVITATNAAMVYCGRICKDDETGCSFVEKVEYHRGNVFKYLLYQNFIGSTSFPLINSRILREAGGFDEQMQSAQDCDAWLRIAEKYEIEYISEPLVIYHTHRGEQITSNPKKKISGLERLNQKYKRFVDDDPVLWHRRHMILVPYYAMIKEKKKAFDIWMRCVAKCPWKIKDNLSHLREIIRN